MKAFMNLIDEMALARSESQQIEAFDPYLSFAEMPFRKTYYPLGFPLEVVTNSKDVLEAAEESWGCFAKEFETPPIEFRIGTLPGSSTELPPVSIHRAHRNLLAKIADHQNFCINDYKQGFTFGWLTEQVVAHRNYFRYHFLDAVALGHIANRFSAPVHGACVELAGSGVLLCGDSGAGKSTLAFACARRGWNYITDDASFLLTRQSGRRVVGNCHMLRFRPTASELFPEVADRPITPRVAGKPSIEVRTADLPGIRCVTSANVEHLVFLNRSESIVQEIVPLSKHVARRYLHLRLYGMDELRKPQLAAIERLMAAQVLEMRYHDLDWAVDRLERLAREAS
jgi:hypothetical protein